MNEDIAATEQAVKRDKVFNFLQKNKFKIIAITVIIILAVSSFSIYSFFKEKEKINFSNIYIEATVMLKNDELNKAEQSLKKLVLSKDPFYSMIALNLIINKKFFKKNIEIIDFFDYLIKSKKFDKEQKNLLIYKKSIFMMDFISENELINQLNPIINTDSVWKVNSLILIADYFFHKKDYLKSKEFYERILNLKDSTREQINYAKSQLNKI